MTTRRQFLKAAAGGLALAAGVGALTVASKAHAAAKTACITFPAPSADWGRVRYIVVGNFYAPLRWDSNHVYRFGQCFRHLDNGAEGDGYVRQAYSSFSQIGAE